MAIGAACGEAEGMHSSHSLEPQAAVAAAEAVSRAAHEFQLRVGAAEAVPDLPVTLACLEDTIARLATAVQMTGETVVQGSVGADDRPTPEARALSWHLYFLAARLRAAQEAVPAAQDWAGRMLAPGGSSARAA
jgi:hypothetical protein